MNTNMRADYTLLLIFVLLLAIFILMLAGFFSIITLPLRADQPIYTPLASGTNYRDYSEPAWISMKNGDGTRIVAAVLGVTEYPDYGRREEWIMIVEVDGGEE